MIVGEAGRSQKWHFRTQLTGDFGNLLIIDHGDAYLSIYGNNEALLKQVGQAVQGGDTVATVGNTGGNPESGLYFEIRRQGQPIDPLSWATLK